MARRMSPQRFEELVSEALDRILQELAAAIDNVVVLVEDRNAEEPGYPGPVPGHRVDRADPGTRDHCRTPSRSTGNCWRCVRTTTRSGDEVAITVIHEIAHHFGIDDERLHQLVR